MPSYDYECLKCGHLFEVFQNITDTKLKKCPRCKGKLKRLPGIGAGIIFKGSGFYATDYRKPSYLEAAKKDKEKSTEPSGTEGGKTSSTSSSTGKGKDGGAES